MKKTVNKHTVKEVAVLCSCSDRTVRKWAAANNVQFIGEGDRRKDYRFTNADIKRFIARPKPGRRWNNNDDSGEKQ